MNEIDLRRFDLNLLVVFEVLMTERMVSKGKGGIGFRNYWASTIKNLLDDIEDSKYKEWQAKYGG